MKTTNAEKFWERFDKQRRLVNISIKTITEQLGLSYPLLITQRSRQIYPSVTTACKLAKILGTTVEYLTTGEELVDVGNPDGEGGSKLVPLDIVLALSHATPEDLTLVRRLFRLPDSPGEKN